MASSERVEVIDALRGVAALGVVLYHYLGYIPLLGVPVGPVGSVLVRVTRYGNVGVPVFFVLSGFVIAMTASRYQFDATTGRRFVLRRMIRIAPPYWFMIAFITAVMLAARAEGFLKTTSITPGQVAAHFIYMQDLLGFPPLDIAYWTLCLEVQFYLVFAASAIAVHKLGPGVRVVWFTALTAVSVLVNFFDAVPQPWFPRLWYQFGTGVLLWYAGRERSARLALAALLPILGGLGVFRSNPADIAVVIVAGLLLCRSRPLVAAPARLGVLLGLGKISYSLYLVHGIISLGLAAWFRAAARNEAASWVAISAATTGAIVFAAALYYFCERRAIGWSRALRVSSTPQSVKGQIGDASPNQALQ